MPEEIVSAGRGEVVLVKLGGSVITDKSRLRTFREETCRRLGKEMSGRDGSLIVVHGAGSFGHIIAREHRLNEGYIDESQLHPVAIVQRDVRELNTRVLEALIDGGVRGVSIPPAASATFEGKAVKRFDSTLFEKMMSLGLVPVTFGDVVPDESLRFSICSGDLMMAELARRFRPRLAIFCADVDGVFTSDPRSDDGARLIPELGRTTLDGIRRTESVNPDVTGSIFGKLERMLDIASHCEKCMILNGDVPDRLRKALEGEEVPSTLVSPG
ncbi:TPA: isopentenyl phosphate kinase family protein [Thermoplasmata archaeon]|nr:isopentenyl phosphate kinase family protein [Thermoplasmata archaeon]